MMSVNPNPMTVSADEGAMTAGAYLRQLTEAHMKYFPTRSFGWLIDLSDRLAVGEKDEVAAFARELRRCADGLDRTIKKGRLGVLTLESVIPSPVATQEAQPLVFTAIPPQSAPPGHIPEVDFAPIGQPVGGGFGPKTRIPSDKEELTKQPSKETQEVVRTVYNPVIAAMISATQPAATAEATPVVEGDTPVVPMAAIVVAPADANVDPNKTVEIKLEQSVDTTAPVEDGPDKAEPTWKVDPTAAQQSEIVEAIQSTDLLSDSEKKKFLAKLGSPADQPIQEPEQKPANAPPSMPFADWTNYDE